MKKSVYNKINPTIKKVATIYQVAPMTVANWVKEGLLDLDENRHVTLESLRIFQAKYAGKQKLHARANKHLKDVHDAVEVSQVVQTELQLPSFDESLCDRYEAMLSESYKNKEGISYTPPQIIDDMMGKVEMNASTMFLDPCCGTGNFLVKAIRKGVAPENVYGFDTDLNAVLIARRRIMELTGSETCHVFCADFLKESQKLKLQFDLVFTNPPWGKKLSRLERKEYARIWHTGICTDTSSLFLFAILSVLRPGGIAGLLMPESFYNIAAYEDARRAVLQRTILQIKNYGKPFKNMYSACSVLVENTLPSPDHSVACFDGTNAYQRLQKSFLDMPKHILNYWTSDTEMKFIEQLMRHPHLTLKGYATWGLGIVTGNNANICKRSRQMGYKPMYRGKDIFPDRLAKAEMFINPDDFSRCQQVSSMELFHAPVKLIYRFISNELVFFCDTKQRYILNSANMLVLDKDFPISAEQLADILNAPLTQWLFKQLFHTHKVLKGDLEALPIFTDSALHGSFNLLDLDGQALK